MSAYMGCLKPGDAYTERLLRAEGNLPDLNVDWIIDLWKACSPDLRKKINAEAEER